MDQLVVPWSTPADEEELRYEQQGFTKTKGTVFMMPPPRDVLVRAFQSRHKNTILTVGARALSKHFARRDCHPFWQVPSGNQVDKNLKAEQHLKTILDDSTWKNILRLHGDIIILEMRVPTGYGMRWRLFAENRAAFIGFLEPQIFTGQHPQFARVAKGLYDD